MDERILVFGQNLMLCLRWTYTGSFSGGLLLFFLQVSFSSKTKEAMFSNPLGDACSAQMTYYFISGVSHTLGVRYH